MFVSAELLVHCLYAGLSGCQHIISLASEGILLPVLSVSVRPSMLDDTFRNASAWSLKLAARVLCTVRLSRSWGVIWVLMYFNSWLISRISVILLTSARMPPTTSFIFFSSTTAEFDPDSLPILVWRTLICSSTNQFCACISPLVYLTSSPFSNLTGHTDWCL